MSYGKQDGSWKSFSAGAPDRQFCDRPYERDSQIDSMEERTFKKLRSQFYKPCSNESVTRPYPKPKEPISLDYSIPLLQDPF
jgi:hypothetical protein